MGVTRYCIVLTGLLFALVSKGHHSSIGIYDPDLIGEIEGQITSIFWRNPHIRLEIQRVGDDGVSETWQVEFGSVNTVERLGISRSIIDEGDRVTVAGSLGRNDRKIMFADSIVLSTGEDASLQAISFEARYGATPEEAIRAARSSDAELRQDIFRVWIPNGFTLGEIDHQFPFTEAGRRALDDWDAVNDPALRCIPPGFPTAMDNPYPIEFVDRGDTITIRLEEWDGVRTIHMTDTETQEPALGRMGYSTGRWQGRSLVVETTAGDWPYIDELGAPQSENSHIVERFTLSEDGVTLRWEATVTDPANYTEPFPMTGRYIWIPGHAIKEFNCALPD